MESTTNKLFTEADILTINKEKTTKTKTTKSAKRSSLQFDSKTKSITFNIPSAFLNEFNSVFKYRHVTVSETIKSALRFIFTNEIDYITTDFNKIVFGNMKLEKITCKIPALIYYAVKRYCHNLDITYTAFYVFAILEYYNNEKQLLNL